MITDTHTLNVKTTELRNDAGNIPTGVTIVLSVAHVKLTPGGSPLTDVVGGDFLTRSGSPSTLRVLIDGDILDFVGVETEGEGLVRSPEAIHLTVRTVSVPENDFPGLIVATLETDNVLVLVGIGLVYLNDIASPGNADITLVIPVQSTASLGGGSGTESLGDIVSAGGGSVPVARGVGSRARARARASSGSGTRAHGRLDIAGSGSEFDGRSDGGGGGSRGGSGSGLRDLAEPVVDPGLEDTIDGGIDHISVIVLTLLHLDIEVGAIGGSGSGRVLDLSLCLRVGVTALMAVKTSDGGPSGQGRRENDGFLEMHNSFLGWLRRKVCNLG